MKHSSFLLVLLASTGTALAVDYQKQVEPIFRTKCYACHSVEKKVKGDLALDKNKLPESIGAGKVIDPSNVAKSKIVSMVKLPDDDDDVMPPKGKNRLTGEEVAILEAWVKEGASLEGGAASAPPAPAPAGTAAPAGGGVQDWTNSQGVTIKATFLGLQGDSVLLKVASTGVTHTVPLAKLSPESQAQARAAAK